jgi:hypothetical protein
MAQEVEYLPSNCEALSSNSSTNKKKEKEKNLLQLNNNKTSNPI